MKEKTILITGSTDGIGKATAGALASNGWHVIIHGRSQGKVHQTLETLCQDNPSGKLSGVWGDFSSLAEVAAIPAQVSAITSRLDVLLNNAGVIMPAFMESTDGYEMTFAVNHLAHFFLTHLLLPLIPEGSRIVNVASQVHSQTLNTAHLNDPRYFSSIDAYSDSKMCNVLFTYALHRRIHESLGIAVTCLHPGVVNTKMLVQTWGRVGIPVEAGIRTSVFAVSPDKAPAESGVYWVDERKTRSTPASYEKNLQEELWKLSSDLIRKAGFEFREDDYYRRG